MSRYLIMPSPAQVGTGIVTSGLVGHWDVGNFASYPKSGTTWTDLSGSGNTGTLTSGPSFVNNLGGYISVDGADDFISVPHNVSSMNFASGQTIHLVLMPTHTGNNTLRRGVFHQAYGGPGSIIYNTTNVGGVHTFQYYFGTNGGDGEPYSELNSNFTVVANELASICITRDQASNTCRWYKNGTLITTGNAGSYASTANGTNPIWFGKGYTGITNFLGRYYLVSVYNRALSAAEVEQNYNAVRGRFLPDSSALAATQPPTSGLVGYWDAGNSASYAGSGTTWTDLSGNGNNGTLLNEPTFETDRGGGIKFDGTNDEVNCGRGSSLAIANNVTCVVVVKWPTGYGGGLWQSLVTKRTPWAQNGRGDFILNWNPSHLTTGSLIMSYWPSAGVERTHRTVLTTNFNPNEWHHITAVWSQSGTSTVQTLYKNGTQLSTGTTAGNIPASTDLDLRIGNLDNSYSGANEYGNCTVALVQLYNRALSAAEITQNFNAFRGRFGI